MIPPILAIRVTRDIFLEHAVLSTVELDLPYDGLGFLPYGYSAEPARCIPVGVYEVTLRDSPANGPDTLELEAVPGWRHIQLHAGNDPRTDSRGCILLGLARDVATGRVLRSRVAVEWLRARAIEVFRAGGRVTVEVRRAG